MNGSPAATDISFVIMGVAGCGKSTLGRALAERLGKPFIEGDDLHPEANVAKMSAGIPLTDEDRQPFLSAVAKAIREAGSAGAVVSCSALKRAYRTKITEEAGTTVCFVLPTLSKEQLSDRLASRKGHFMPASMLESQLAAFERPQADELSIIVAGTLTPSSQADEVLRRISACCRSVSPP